MRFLVQLDEVRQLAFCSGFFEVHELFPFY